jgi:hypothetical protein
MNNQKLPQFKKYFDRFKDTTEYKERQEQFAFVEIAKEIIEETLKIEPLKNENLTGLIQALKWGCTDETFEKYVKVNVLDEKRREEILEKDDEIGEYGYTAAGKTAINHLTPKQLNSVKEFLRDAFLITNITDAKILCDEFDAKDVPEVKSGVYSPWLFYINPTVFPIINNTHTAFLNWLSISSAYSECVEAFATLKELVDEKELGTLDAFAYRFEEILANLTNKREPLKILELNGKSIFKMSHGIFIKDKEFRVTKTAEKLKELKWICLHETTGKGQAEEFQNAEIGDYVFLCYGGIELNYIGKITSDFDYVPNEMLDIFKQDEGWIYRTVQPLFNPINSDVSEFKDVRSFWMPSGNSTFYRIPESEMNYANENIFIPKYGVKIINNTSNKIGPKMQPLNLILYGPPGTGKTYNTIIKAAEIITGQEYDTPEKYNIAKEVFKQKLYDQVEFITFHQNYTYEDFLAGLRPDIDPQASGLRFKEHKGVFYKISERSRKNFEESKSGKTYIEPTFEEVLNEFLKPLAERDEPVELSTIARGVSFKIYQINDKNLGLEKQSGSKDHTLSISTLKGLYEGKREYNLQGLGVYYYPTIEKLKSIAITLRKEVGKIELENYVLIIDEINRANISRVFGELITLLEPDKRLGAKHELKLRLPGLPDDEPFSVAPNLYIVATMNTADKSIALIDIALRRRFTFVPMYPNKDLVSSVYKQFFIALNESILQKKGADFLIGHSYLMDEDGTEVDFESAMNFKIIPLLNEYFYSNKKGGVFSILEPLKVHVSQYEFIEDPYIGAICKKI